MSLPPKKRLKTSETFPEDVKKLVVEMKDTKSTYEEITREVNRRFPTLKAKMYQVRQVYLERTAFVSLTIPQRLEIINLRDTGLSWQQIADKFNIKKERARDIYKKREELSLYEKACVRATITGKVNIETFKSTFMLICTSYLI